MADLVVPVIEHRHPGAETESHGAVEEGRLGGGADQLLGDGAGRFELRVRQGDGEDHAAVARQRIGAAQGRAQPAADLAHDRVAGDPAESLVDGGEVVRVDEDQRERRLAQARFLQFLGKHRLEAGAVGKTGDRVLEDGGRPARCGWRGRHPWRTASATRWGASAWSVSAAGRSILPSRSKNRALGPRSKRRPSQALAWAASSASESDRRRPGVAALGHQLFGQHRQGPGRVDRRQGHQAAARASRWPRSPRRLRTAPCRQSSVPSRRSANSATGGSGPSCRSIEREKPLKRRRHEQRDRSGAAEAPDSLGVGAQELGGFDHLGFKPTAAILTFSPDGPMRMPASRDTTMRPPKKR